MGFFSDIVDGFVKSNPIGQAVNLFSSGITSAINRHSQKETNKRNAEQNELNRQFSAEEAAKNRQFQADQNVLQNEFNAQQANAAFERSTQFQREMWNKENEYNSPAAQVKRLTDAGFNPNLFGGDNTAGSVGSASSPAASGSLPSGSAASAPSSIPMQSYSVTNPLLESAQIRLANASADKAENEAERTKRLLPGEVKIQGRTYDLVGSEVDVNKAQVKNLEKMASKQDAEINLINENIGKIQHENSLIDKQGNLVQKEIDSFEQKLVSALEEAASRVKLNLANASEVASKIALNYANAQKARLEGQSYVLDNYLDSCKLALYKNDSAWTYSILQNGIRLDASDRARRSKHESAEFEPDYKMYEQMNSDVIAFLRALGSAVNFSLGSHASVRP